jgi:phosphoribosyl 1,2-cyclic phosphate phosphodiesterase
MTTVTILGAGGSQGVPQIGEQWGACDPAEPKNRRSRPSIVIEEAGETLLVDCSPDLRFQVLAAGIRRITGCFLTHAHADHIHGIDDLRGFWMLDQKPIPVFADSETLTDARARFRYLFEGTGSGLYHPVAEPRLVEDGRFRLGALSASTFPLDHRVCTSYGIRIGDVAYTTDLVTLDEAGFAALDGVRLWIVAALRREPHPTHAHLDRVLEWIERVKPERTVLTNMTNRLDYRELLRTLPPGVVPSYDGMRIETAGSVRIRDSQCEA